MTQTTPKLALVKPGGGSTGLNTPADRVDIDVINANSDKIDAFATQTDARLDTVEAAKAGAYKITPTSVTGSGVTIDGDGSVVLSSLPGGTTFQINGVFSARFRAYRILFRYDATDNGSWYLRYLSAGAENTSSVYRYSLTTQSSSDGGAPFTSVGMVNQFPVAAAVSSRGLVDITLDGPFLSELTIASLRHAANNDAGAAWEVTGNLTYGANVAFDGFSLISGGVAFSGILKVYGIN